MPGHGICLKGAQLNCALVSAPRSRTVSPAGSVPKFALPAGSRARHPLALDCLPLMVHSGARLILLSRIDGDAPRAS
jgi:hypothetical protein